MPKTHGYSENPGHRLRPHRHRPGGGIRLRRHPGLPGPEGGGLRGRSCVNSNPATIMTDTTHRRQGVYGAADAGIRRQDHPLGAARTPSSPGIGGQTGLNLAMQLEKKGVLEECQVRAAGHRASSPSSRRRIASCSRSCASDRASRCLPSDHRQLHGGRRGRTPQRSAIPVVLRPAFTLGGTGGGFADDEEELLARSCKNALKLSPGPSGSGGEEHQGLQGNRI